MHILLKVGGCILMIVDHLVLNLDSSILDTGIHFAVSIPIEKLMKSY